MSKIRFFGAEIPSASMRLTIGLPGDAVTRFAVFLFGKAISCGCIFSSGMGASSRCCGRLREIKSGHRADSKTNATCRTDEGIHPLASGGGKSRFDESSHRAIFALESKKA